jgi:hypothetical protein
MVSSLLNNNGTLVVIDWSERKCFGPPVSTTLLLLPSCLCSARLCASHHHDLAFILLRLDGTTLLYSDAVSQLAQRCEEAATRAQGQFNRHPT